MHVEARSVGKRFGRLTALDQVSLTFAAGTRTALIGPNGSGKSTLVRVLQGMLAAEGEVLVDGAPLMAAAIASRTAYVPQIAPRLAASVGEMVACIASLRRVPRQRVHAIAARLALDLDAFARRPFRTLSGGQRQKVLAALALAAEAELLLLDEPTASMDPSSRAEFFRIVESLPASTTVLLCSHRLDEIRRLVDRVVVLEDGRVRWQGDAAAYLDDHAEAVIEVHVTGDRCAPWLSGRGFHAGAPGWWSRSLPIAERAAVVGEIGRELNGQVRDIVARDVERLQPKGPGVQP